MNARTIRDCYGEAAIADVLATFGQPATVVVRSDTAADERRLIAAKLRKRARILAANDPEAAAFAIEFADELLEADE